MHKGFLPWKRIFIFGVELFFGINVVLLDLLVFSQSHGSTFSLASDTAALAIPTPPIATKLPEPAISPSPVPLAQPAIIQTNSSVKEVFIPLGSGQTDSTDWIDIPGALGYIDSNSYVGIKKVLLEATVTIPNGNETAWIRLFNKTDGHPVWYSETSWNGGNTQFLISQPITFDSGNKLYQVQLKNQLPSLAIVSNARLHITLH